MRVVVDVNGVRHERDVEPRTLLSDFVRHDLGLTGTNVGEPVRSCLMLAVQANGHSLRTVESLATADRMHPVQQAFHEAHALQCGFCTPGFLMSIEAFLREDPDPSEEEIRAALSGNLCRCTGYLPIIEAVRLAAARLREPAS